MKMAVKNHFGD